MSHIPSQANSDTTDQTGSAPTSADSHQPPPTRVHPTPRQLLGILAIAALPWCAFTSLLVINPKYELHLVDPATPGLLVLSAALIAQLLAAGLAYAFIGFFNALAQRNTWSSRPRIIAYALVVVAFSVLCSLPLLLLAVLGPAAAFLIQAEMP